MASTENANLVLVGDVDMLSDRLWVQAQNFFGQRLVNAFANNGDFVINALDNLSGSAALIGLRSRATYTRPFTTVEALRRRADIEFRATEDRLDAQLTRDRAALGELQAARNDGNSLLMSPEQQAEIQRFQTSRCASARSCAPCAATSTPTSKRSAPGSSSSTSRSCRSC